MSFLRKPRAGTGVLAAALAPLLGAGEAAAVERTGPNATGIVASENTSPSVAPGDPTGAIGIDHYVEAVNDRIAVYERRGLRPRSRATNNEFWGVRFLAVGDPQVVWDTSARRWYASVHVPQRNQTLIAWSKGADPSDLRNGWCRFALPGRRLLPDFPMLGYSRNHIVLGVNMADAAHESVLFSRIWAIAKPPPGSRDCRRPEMTAWGTERSPLRQADGRRAFTPIPVRPVRPGPYGYVIASDCLDDGPGESGEEGCGGPERRGDQLTVWRLDDSGGAPRLVRAGAVEVPSFGLPDPVRQPGTRDRLDPGDTRLTQAISNRDPSLGVREAIWTQHTVAGSGGGAVIRWYEIAPDTLSVLRNGTVASRKHSTLYGAISPTTRGDAAVLHYLLASRTLRPQIRARSRDGDDPPGAMRGEVRLGHSRGAISGCEDVCRLGDYAGASPDPVHPNLVWGSNQVIGPPVPGEPLFSTWRTRNFALR